VSEFDAALAAYARQVRLGALLAEHRDAVARLLGLPEWIKLDMDVSGPTGLDMAIARLVRVAESQHDAHPWLVRAHDDNAFNRAYAQRTLDYWRCARGWLPRSITDSEWCQFKTLLDGLGYIAVERWAERITRRTA
jgi:hypothetical protein